MANARSNTFRAGSRRAWGFLGLFLAAIGIAGQVRGQGVEPPPPPPTRPAVLLPLPESERERSPVPDPAEIEPFSEVAERADSTIKVRLGHGRILSLKKDLFAGQNGQPSIAVGDPGVLDFIPLSARQIRLLGLRLGSTDLVITTADNSTLSYEVVVEPNLELLRGQLRQAFPNASITLGQVGDHIAVEGQARDSAQIAQIIQSLRTSIAATVGTSPGFSSGSSSPSNANASGSSGGGLAGNAAAGSGMAVPGVNAGGGTPGGGATTAIVPVKILNLIRVPGSQQVLLKVRVAELNRTAFRQIGANVLVDSSNGAIFGTQIGNSVAGVGTSDLFQPQAGTRLLPSKAFVGAASSSISSANTLFGIFQNSNFEILLNALRRNSVLKILAEPNLVAFNGHKASFLAGGEFPIPVPQVGATGVASTITVNFKKFGVQLDFLPEILDGEAIRLTVDPEVSSIDKSLGTTLVAGGSPVPGLNTRNAHTTVELRQGQTLAIAGLMQLTLDGQSDRIPGLGDLPVLGPFFSNTTSQRVEKELVVLVTPYLVEPLNDGQVPPGPGDEVNAPNDLEFYILNRIEGRTGRDFRATTDGADPLRIGRLIGLERKNIRGPYGFSD